MRGGSRRGGSWELAHPTGVVLLKIKKVYIFWEPINICNSCKFSWSWLKRGEPFVSQSLVAKVKKLTLNLLVKATGVGRFINLVSVIWRFLTGYIDVYSAIFILLNPRLQLDTSFWKPHTPSLFWTGDLTFQNFGLNFALALETHEFSS